MQNGKLKELTWTKLENAWSCNTTCNHNLTRSLSMVANHAPLLHTQPTAWEDINLRAALRKTTGSDKLSLVYWHFTARTKAAVKFNPEERIRTSDSPTTATPALFTSPYGSSFSSTSSDAFENIRSLTGAFQMAVRAFGNHQTTPPISPAKTGAVMSPLHEGSVNGMSWSTGWHTNCTYPTRTLK